MRTNLLADDLALTEDAEELVYQLVAKLVDNAALNDALIFDADSWRTLAEIYELLVEECFRSRSPFPVGQLRPMDSSRQAGLEHACHV